MYVALHLESSRVYPLRERARSLPSHFLSGRPIMKENAMDNIPSICFSGNFYIKARLT